jgi:hypothetical protein
MTDGIGIIRQMRRTIEQLRVELAAEKFAHEKTRQEFKETDRCLYARECAKHEKTRTELQDAQNTARTLAEILVGTDPIEECNPFVKKALSYPR